MKKLQHHCKFEIEVSKMKEVKYGGRLLVMEVSG